MSNETVKTYNYELTKEITLPPSTTRISYVENGYVYVTEIQLAENETVYVSYRNDNFHILLNSVYDWNSKSTCFTSGYHLPHKFQGWDHGSKPKEVILGWTDLEYRSDWKTRTN